MLPEGNPALQEAVKELQAQHPGLKSICLSASWSGEQVHQVLQSQISGRQSFWLAGDGTVYDQLREPPGILCRVRVGSRPMLPVAFLGYRAATGLLPQNLAECSQSIA
jgi:hypothetical protein